MIDTEKDKKRKIMHMVHFYLTDARGDLRNRIQFIVIEMMNTGKAKRCASSL
jgi:hypothetical protein